MRLAVINDSWPLTKPFFNQIREISREFGVYTDQELRALLKFYHSLGKIIHFGIICRHFIYLENMFFIQNSGHQHGGSSVLKNTVIFSPAAFSKIIYRLTTKQFLV